MPIRITGMNSNLDTESIIKEMVKAQKSKVDKLKGEQTKLQWKQDAWKDLNSKIYKLFNSTLNDMRFESGYKMKVTKASNSSAVTIVTGKDAVNGVQELEIIKQAKTGLMTGGKINSSSTVKASTKLSDLDPTNFGSGQSGSFNVTLNGKITEIAVNGDTTISDVVSKLKATGLNANFDEKNQRFYISSPKGGAEGDFSLTASDAAGNTVLKTLGIDASLDSDPATLETYKKYASYYVSGDRAATLANMQALMDKESASLVASYKASYDSAKESIKKVDEAITKIQDKENYIPGKTAEQIKADIDTLKNEIDAETDDTIKAQKQEQLKKLQEGHTYATQIENYDKEKERLQKTVDQSLEYISVDADGKATATAKLTGEVEKRYYDRAEYAASVIASYVPGSSTGSAQKVPGRDGVIKLNNTEYTSTNNVYEINGLTITVNAETTEKISVTTMDDTAGMYDMVKNFIKEYNSIINEMDKLYNAETAKGYRPLTDEEKETMSDKEVEKWEEKIKESIMRRDDVIDTVATSMKGIMLAGVEINGKKMYLADFGINTLEYWTSAENEKNAYHIDNDPDDPNTSKNPDKLKSMISSDPATVATFFAELTNNLYKSLDKQMARTDFSSYGTLYNDKLMKEQYDDYTSRIKAQEKKVTALEDKWYAKFSAMETALAKMQSGQSAISGLLGG